ncbi:lytic transglycosylase domain-containing protein [Curtobacterium poinsettiae]|uniref:lytic transglycosylase domain-containing protein n=1 Tax=Curtobacterium poinsettiae TaxID=159612 RepID=UPI0021C89EBF|nr:lytic transglycosylase domain-containing protein [Curtobacterium flaccumfaciens]MCU0153769.1 lytic transglycosylase domain-containing protein [Curtobacterium flaccumfaciens pv. poinsettiae]MDD1384665.1 lytic transglycosylase domain-containing protein [Curtobacterium flaccumfaciens pv. poinsettiae]UXN14309.1 lytic transglycosylase domain-containing protein [Curtobacterium flaccumfaciens pv. poinsettiae]
MQRTRTTETSAFGVTPQAAATGPVATPKSVAANRVSDERVASFAHDALVAEQGSPKQRTATVQRRTTPKLAEPARVASVNAVARKRATAPMLSFVGVFLFVGGSLFNPLQADVAQAAVDTPVLVKAPAPQQYTAHGTYGEAAADRDGYGVTVPAPKVVKPVVEDDATDATDDAADAAAPESEPVSAANTLAATAATPDPGSAQAIALQQVTARGWGTDQYNCLVSLWNKESGWRVNAYNPSGAYGIPQALPGSKMATAGADWQTNPATQITWGLNYIAGVYGTPCGAWGHSQANNWY